MDSVLVKKFGGTSVGSIERIEYVADRLLLDRREKGQDNFVVVASAMAGETNRLVEMAHKVHPTARGGEAYDLLLASGEQVSISLLALALQKRGLKALPLLAFQLGIKTDSIYSQARIQNIETDLIKGLLGKGVIPVVAGFQGVDDFDRVTTLGRGGSDTTAVALAAALGSSVCEIYTDVEGVFTADPRVEPKARKLSQLAYEEMMEMASLGSKVLHFRCVEIAAKFNTSIHVRSTFSESEGTIIKNRENPMEAPVVSAVTHDPRITILRVEPVPPGVGQLADLFQELSRQEVLVDIISQAQGNVGQRLAFSIADDDAQKGIEILKNLFPSSAEITQIPSVAKISIVGVGMKSHPGVAARFFNVLKVNNIDLKLVTTSDIKMSGVVPREQTDLAVQKLHEEFCLDLS